MTGNLAGMQTPPRTVRAGFVARSVLAENVTGSGPRFSRRQQWGDGQQPASSAGSPAEGPLNSAGGQHGLRSGIPSPARNARTRKPTPSLFSTTVILRPG